MADLSLKVADRAQHGMDDTQLTLVTSVDVSPMQPLLINASGQWALGDATVAANAAIYGLASTKAQAGFPVTAIRRGVFDGLDLSGLAFNQSVYLSDTSGALADAAGTVPINVGRVIPGNANVIADASDKLLFVDLVNGGA